MNLWKQKRHTTVLNKKCQQKLSMSRFDFSCFCLLLYTLKMTVKWQYRETCLQFTVKRMARFNKNICTSLKSSHNKVETNRRMQLPPRSRPSPSRFPGMPLPCALYPAYHTEGRSNPDRNIQRSRGP